MGRQSNDDVFRGILERGYRVYGYGIDQTVREIVELGGRPLAESLLSHGWKPWRDDDMRELKRLVDALHEYLLARRREGENHDSDVA